MDLSNERTLWSLFLFTVYFLLFTGAVIGLASGRVKRCRNRPPVEFKFLRGPGETLRRRMATFEENFFPRLILAGLVPLLAAIVVSYSALRFQPQTVTHLWLESGLVVIVFVGTLIPVLRWGSRSLIRYHNDRLGYLGERFVGDCLEPLKRKGWFIFHDVPGLAGERKFNLDHVAVGPGGVWAIETKTRRKGRARRGFDPHKVFFDGKNLVWPWGEDPYGPEQARFNSEWLQAWLLKRTGIKLEVYPVLALPGWYVVKPSGAEVRVVRPEWLLEDLPKARTVLTSDQIDLIVRQLDLHCRDVED
jgi:hypothetical protein